MAVYLESMMDKKGLMASAVLFFLFCGAIFMIFGVAPEEASQGLVQKIFYFHVASAMAMYVGYAVAGVGAVLYLLKRKLNYHHLSFAGVVVGQLFCTMVLCSGPLWAKPIWGTWWTWDPRLTTTFLLWLIFFSVILLKKYFHYDTRGPLYISILTLFGLLDIPLVFFSVKLWRGLHPQVLGQEDSMPAEMRFALLVSMISMKVLAWVLIYLYYRVLKLQTVVDSKGEYHA